MKHFYLYIIIFINFLGIDSYAQSPGNVSTNLQWWFKANSGTSTTTDAAQINTWTNSGSFATTSVIRSTTPASASGYPMYKSAIVNNNPVVRFSSSNVSAFCTSTWYSLTNMDPTKNNTTAIVVFKSTQNGGDVLSQYESPSLISTERGCTQLDYTFGFVTGKVAIKNIHNDDNFNSLTNSTYIDDVARIATITRLKDATVANPSTIGIYMNAKADATATSAGTSYTLGSSDCTNNGYYAGFMIGGQIYSTTEFLSGTAFNGDIAEVIVYDAVLTSANLLKVQSYLAVKYGITLDQTSAYNYQRSDATVIWDGTASSGYNKDIAGIGQDDNSGLNQTQSQSINSGSMVLMKTPSAMANNEFMMWGDNGLSVAANTNLVDVPTGIETRLKREWKTTETGDVGTVTVTVDLSSVGGSKTLADLRLIVDDDATYASGTTTLYSAASLTSNIATFNSVDFNNTTQRYFTVGSVNKSRTPLPVEFINVQFIKNNQIEWTVADETNISEYIISGSSDGIKWSNLANEIAINHSNTITKYRVDISNQLQYVNYFKIIAIENGKITNESKILSNNITTNKKQKITISPDPCSSFFHVTYTENFNLENITDMSGKVLTNIKSDIIPNGYKVYTNDLPNGVYFLTIKDANNFVQTQRFEVID